MVFECAGSPTAVTLITVLFIAFWQSVPAAQVSPQFAGDAE